MSITREEILRLVKSAGLSFSDTEISETESYLIATLNSLNRINELNTDKTEPTFRVYEMQNIWRNDELQEYEVDQVGMLALAAETRDNQIKVPKIL